MSHCLFIRNNAKTWGGAIFQYKGNLLINATRFLNNTAIHFSGAVSVMKKSIVHIFHCTFTRNKAKYGSAVLTSGSLSVSISHCLFIRNHAKESGGAIYHNENDLLINATRFVNNTAVHDSGAISVTNKSVTHIFHCIFTQNKASFGGAISTVERINISIFHCLFVRNHANASGGAIYHNGNVLLANATRFVNSTAGQDSGAIAVTNKSVAHIFHCILAQNKADVGGALSTASSFSVSISHCSFIRNYANGTGGALSSKKYVEIVNCSFTENLAQRGGGTIYQEGLNSTLLIKNYVFATSSRLHDHHHNGIEVIRSSGNILLKDVSIHDMGIYNTQSKLLIHTSSFEEINFTDINFQCSQGKNILATLPEKQYLPGEDEVIFVAISCSLCPSNLYSVVSGKLGPNLDNQTHAKCYRCPFGGSCENGQIRATNNVWGYRSTKHEIRFSICPFGYCCFGNECTSYSSCTAGREGTLCGKCGKGLTENILNAKCLLPEQCYQPWVWLMVLIAGVVYIGLFMYLKEATLLATTLLIPENFFVSAKCTLRSVICSIKGICKKLTAKISQLPQMANNYSLSEIVECEVQLENPDTIQQLKYSRNNNSDATLFPGLMKIMIGFYQTVVLFKIYNVGKSSGFTHIQEVIATLFNLRTDHLFFQNLSWCPFDNIRGVPKLLFKASFTVYLLIILLILFLIFNIFKRFQNRDSDCTFNSLYSRLYCCTLRILLISYATITVSCFTLLSCVDLGSYGKVLYIDGSIQCYTWWQFIIIAIVCL